MDDRSGTEKKEKNQMHKKGDSVVEEHELKIPSMSKVRKRLKWNLFDVLQSIRATYVHVCKHPFCITRLLFLSYGCGWT